MVVRLTVPFLNALVCNCGQWDGCAYLNVLSTRPYPAPVNQDPVHYGAACTLSEVVVAFEDTSFHEVCDELKGGDRLSRSWENERYAVEFLPYVPGP